MNHDPENSPDSSRLEQVTARQAERKLKARRDGKRSAWFGLGMFGLVGWSVVLPSLGGVALGGWIDRQFPSQVSWTLTLLFVGLIIGCANAWYWLNREGQSL